MPNSSNEKQPNKKKDLDLFPRVLKIRNSQRWPSTIINNNGEQMSFKVSKNETTFQTTLENFVFYSKLETFVQASFFNLILKLSE